MTDFRPVGRLRAYSGGTVPDSHRILYSPMRLSVSQRHSNAYAILYKILLLGPFIKRLSEING